MSKTISVLSALGGAVAGAAIMWGISFAKQPTSPSVHHRPLEENSEQWLLPPGTTLAGIYRDGATDILEAPDKLTLHPLSDKPPGDAPDAIVHEDHAFQPIGTEVKLDPVLYTLRSLSSYRSITMCEFKPAVLLRITRDGRHLDLLFCFSCHDILAYLDGAPCGGAGMSDEGYRSFLRYFHHILPDNKPLKSVHDSFSQPPAS